MRFYTGGSFPIFTTSQSGSNAKRAKDQMNVDWYMAAIVESSDDAIISKDLNGIIASWNAGAERLFGYTATEIVGKSVMILIPQGRMDEEPYILERIRRGERIDHYETVRRRKDGSEVDISLTVSPVRDKNGGLGLGLAIVRHLVELHGGTVSAASPGKERGATFPVTLPLTSRRMETSEDERARLTNVDKTSQNRAQSPDPLRDLRVLVVDDELDARELFRSMLTQYGAEVKVCGSAAEALQTLDEWRPDVLLSDIGMPREDGFEFMKKVRAREPERGGRIPAVAVTAYAGARDERKALATGYQIFISKPIEPVRLAATIASIAGRARKD